MNFDNKTLKILDIFSKVCPYFEKDAESDNGIIKITNLSVSTIIYTKITDQQFIGLPNFALIDLKQFLTILNHVKDSEIAYDTKTVKTEIFDPLNPDSISEDQIPESQIINSFQLNNGVSKANISASNPFTDRPFVDNDYFQIQPIIDSNPPTIYEFNLSQSQIKDLKTITSKLNVDSLIFKDANDCVWLSAVNKTSQIIDSFEQSYPLVSNTYAQWKDELEEQEIASLTFDIGLTKVLHPANYLVKVSFYHVEFISQDDLELHYILSLDEV